MRPLSLAFAMLVMVFAGSLPLCAQDQPIQPALVPVPETTLVAPSTTAPTPAVSESPKPIPVERSIYIPFEELKKTLGDDGQGVFLPYKEFQDMWAKLVKAREEEKQPPPAEAILASAEISGTPAGTAMQWQATLQIESFKDGWATLPLAGKDLAIAKAETGDGGATIRLSENGPEALLPKKGKYTFQLSFYSKLESNTGRGTTSITLPSAAVNRVTMTIPGQGWSFTCAEPGVVFTADQTADDKTAFSAFFGATPHLTLEWQKQGEDSKLTPLLFANVMTRCKLFPGSLSTTIDLNYSVLRSGVSELLVKIPEGQTVLSATGADLKEWTLEGQQVKVTLHTPAKENYHLSLQLESPVEVLPATLAVPAVEAIGVVRQFGELDVISSSELESTTSNPQGLSQQALATPAAAKQLKTPVTSESLGRWRYLKLPWALTLSAKKAEPQVEVESFTKVDLQRDRMGFITRFEYDIRRAGLFETTILLPPGFESLRVYGGPVASHLEEEIEGQKRLKVRFFNLTLGTACFQVSGRALRPSPEADVTVPRLVPENVARYDATMGVIVDRALDVNTKSMGAFRPEEVSTLKDRTSPEGQNKGKEGESIAIQKEFHYPTEFDPPEVPQSFGWEGPQREGATPFTLGFRWRGAVEAAILSFKLKPSQVTGEILTLAEIKEQSAAFKFYLNYDIEYSGLDSFVISMPEALAATLREENRVSKEIDKAYKPENATAGRAYWKISTRDRQLGRFTLEFSSEKPLGALDPTKPTSIDVPELQLHDIFQETGQVAVIKEGNIEILEPQQGAGLEPCDPRELNGPLQQAGVFFAAKWKRHPASLSLPVAKNLLLDVPQALVTYADLTTVVGAGGGQTTEVVYWVKNNTQQFFTVRLPEGSRMVSDLWVDGKNQPPARRAATADKPSDPAATADLLIRLPSQETTQRLFGVRFVYETPTKQILGENGSLDLNIPQLLDASILQTQHTLSLPPGRDYVQFDSPLHLPPRDRGWSKWRGFLITLIPALGPQLPEVEDRPWEAPPSLPQAARGTLQLTREGQLFSLHRLDSPAPITVHFRSRALSHALEAAGFLVALLIGLLLSRASFGTKVFWVFLAGMGVLVVDGLLPASASGFLRFAYLGTITAALFWVFGGFWHRLAKGRRTAVANTKPSIEQPSQPPTSKAPKTTTSAAIEPKAPESGSPPTSSTITEPFPNPPASPESPSSETKAP